MIWVDKKAFKDTYSILKKEKRLEPTYADLKQFIEKAYGIQVFNIILEPIRLSFFDKKIQEFLSKLHEVQIDLLCGLIC